MKIEVTLEVYKALTARLSFDGQTYNQLIEELLSDDTALDPEDSSMDHGTDHRVFLRQAEHGGFASRKLWLPHGTELRAYYKQKEYRARIDNNVWLDESGNRHSSPSAAANAITGTNVNGLRFWQALRPNDRSWRRLEALLIE